MKAKKRKKIIKSLGIFFVLIILIGSRYWYIKKYNHKPLYGEVFSKEISILPLENGKIQKLLVKENDFVKKDDPLVQFDMNLLETKIKQVQTKIDYEKAKENLIQLNEKQVLDEYLNYKKDKEQDLVEVDNKLKLLESIQLSHIMQKAKIRKLQAKLSFIEEKKKTQFIYSPCNGQIKNLFVCINQNVKSDEKLMTVADLDQIWIDTKVQRKEMSKFKIGDNFNIKIKDYPDSKFQGKIFFISNYEKDIAKYAYVDLKVSVNQLKKKPNEENHLLATGMKAYLKHE